MYRHLFIGPFPPVEGGITLLSKELVEYLNKSCSVSVDTVDINFQRKPMEKIIGLLTALISIPFGVAKSDSVSVHLTEKSIVVFGFYTCLICRVLKKPLIFRKFAGSFDLVVNKRGSIYRLIVTYLINNSLCLLETKYLVDIFTRNYPKAVIREFANHRTLANVPLKKITKDSNTIKFVFVGQVKLTKGIQEIVKSVDMLNKLGYKSKFIFDVIGPCESTLIKNLLDSQVGVDYRGSLNNKDILNSLVDYDALVLPTYHEGEGIPGVIIEAMSCGVVPIVSEWRSVREAVPDQVDLVVKIKNEESLFEALKRFINNVDHYRSYANDMIEASRYYSTEKWGNEFKNIITTI